VNRDEPSRARASRDRPGRDQRGPDRPARSGATRMFATAVPGMAALVTADLEHLPGVHVTDSGFDGRSDVILFDVDRGCRPGLWTLRTIEDLFVEVGRTTRSGGDAPPGIAARVWPPDGVQKALSAWAADVRPLSGAMTYRVIARVLQERSFLRTELRNGLGQAIARDKPRWKVADPAQLEVWVTEYAAGRVVAGLRLSDASMRQHEGRQVERPGSLRPTVAAMMVGLAGEPREVLLDPCCGAGTILSEALAAGWPAAAGLDIDPEAVQIASRNVPRAGVAPGDARAIDLPDESVDAVVSNLPFGEQYEVQGEMRKWLTSVLGEVGRVTAVGGRVVLLIPTIPNNAMPPELRLTRKEPIRLLGMKTRLWVCDRVEP
jgi:SAM-dependent methyltransferase